MTKNEITEQLILICKNKLNESKKLQNRNKIEIYETILNILSTPNFFNKQDIEITMNILNDLSIEKEFMLEIIKVLMQEN